MNGRKLLQLFSDELLQTVYKQTNIAITVLLCHGLKKFVIQNKLLPQ